MSDSARAVLLRSLLELELELRREQGEEIVGEEFRTRFADHPRLVHEVIERAGLITAPLPPSPTVSEPLRLAFDDFELGRVIGETTGSIVYEAVQKSLGRSVAVKVLRGAHDDDASRVRRFLHEARKAARLRHPHIVRMHGSGRTADDGYFLVMDLVDGHDAQQLIRLGKVPPRRAAEILVPVAEAVHYANQQQIIHRDLKPSNILLEGGERPLLTDFGHAKELRGGDVRTTAGKILGTLQYMAAEQADPERGEVGARTDVFGLGAVLYALLTGKPPFRGQKTVELLGEVLSLRPIASPRTIDPDVPAGLERICSTCLRRSPSDRYATAEEVGIELRSWLSASG